VSSTLFFCIQTANNYALTLHRYPSFCLSSSRCSNVSPTNKSHWCHTHCLNDGIAFFVNVRLFSWKLLTTSSAPMINSLSPNDHSSAGLVSPVHHASYRSFSNKRLMSLISHVRAIYDSSSMIHNVYQPKEETDTPDKRVNYSCHDAIITLYRHNCQHSLFN